MVFLSHWIDEASQANKITVWFLDEAPNSWSPNREEKRGGCVYGGRVVKVWGRAEKAQRRKEVRIRMAAKAEGCSKVGGGGAPLRASGCYYHVLCILSGRQMWSLQ